ncbi:MAG: HAD-IC family P-type ATPase [Ignavibacteria bacterium]|jgi:Cu+-exporting ATPase|nr:HAD-IC family P-type ATPase [Ignavibacteria bacterium]MCU7503575.1 HAD-IC family P-type ATPase [Ignavibacteria bacterium]MCU7516771.1 HAD-IC family P-type ATPase [Ignavibacteria bacterium]
MDTILSTELKCYHCGDDCTGSNVVLGEKVFCCNGCKTVYEILEKNNLIRYYSLTEAPGVSQRKAQMKNKFGYLDDPQMSRSLVDFTDGRVSSVRFSIPSVHCSSCIWLLENLYKFNPGILSSRVNFPEKEVELKYNESILSLREVAELLSRIGYEPEINLSSTEGGKKKTYSKSLYYKTGIAGFCFANIMLLSFPEYLSLVNNVDALLKSVFIYITLVLSLPVFFYCSSGYFSSAIQGLRKKVINIDFPVSIGILTLFGRSTYEIVFLSAQGYMDSLSGLVFFLLLGRMFQEKTYGLLSFERDYKSYFPAYAVIKTGGLETPVPLSGLKEGDRIIIRNEELVPADSVLIKGSASIDYSFVSGESLPIEAVEGDLIYAGGRQKGTAIELEVIKRTSQSYITRLWNNSDFIKPEENRILTFSSVAGKYFTASVLLIALLSAIYWLKFGSTQQALNVFTSVLIVACPCGLALSAPFTLGNTLRIFGRNKFYLKNAAAVEKLSRINHVVLDKTGTLTRLSEKNIRFFGMELQECDRKVIKAVTHNSMHPLSRLILSMMRDTELIDAEEFKEYPGGGLEGVADGKTVRLGSVSFVLGSDSGVHQGGSSSVYVSINDEIKGYFRAESIYREGIRELAHCLRNYNVSLLSGDYDGEKDRLRDLLGSRVKLFFRQSPLDKLNYVKKLQEQKNLVLMVGDGLNDAGALFKSEVGIAVSEGSVNFSPACEAILEAQELRGLGDFLKFSKTSMKIIYVNLIVSVLYNFAGISFAVENSLTPIVSAILMPLSSITVVAIATLSTSLMAKIRGLN